LLLIVFVGKCDVETLVDSSRACVDVGERGLRLDVGKSVGAVYFCACMDVVYSGHTGIQDCATVCRSVQSDWTLFLCSTSFLSREGGCSWTTAMLKDGQASPGPDDGRR
jgi:hypothetical protein